MSRSDGPASNDAASDDSTGTDPVGDDPVGAEAADWLAASTLRVGLAVLGFVVLLFAIGQVVGFNLLEIVLDALNTNVGRWLIIAFVGLFLIAFALRGFDESRE